MNRMNHKDYKSLLTDHKSHLEFLFAFQLHQAGAPEPEKEYRFHKERRFRFDFCWPSPSLKLAVEIEGGTFKKSRHTSGTGFHNDCEKYNLAALDGWTVLRFDSVMVNNGEAANTTLHALDTLSIK